VRGAEVTGGWEACGVRGAGHALVVVAGFVSSGGGERGVRPSAARVAVSGGLGARP